MPAQKSSTYTSVIVVVDFVGLVCMCDSLFCIICFSIVCGVISGSLFSIRNCITSRAVSVAAQNSGGDSHQPICRLSGITISKSSSGVFFVAGGIV